MLILFAALLPSSAALAALTAPDFAARKASLVAGLQREYASFFNPMEKELYDPAVSYDDPLTSLRDVDAYESNVELLSGASALGRILFCDAFLQLHKVDEGPSERELTTRWTCGFTFSALP